MRQFGQWKRTVVAAVLGASMIGGILGWQATQLSVHAQGNTQVQLSGGPNPVFPPPPM